jgi:hypothetical protein
MGQELSVRCGFGVPIYGGTGDSMSIDDISLDFCFRRSDGKALASGRKVLTSVNA